MKNYKNKTWNTKKVNSWLINDKMSAEMKYYNKNEDIDMPQV